MWRHALAALVVVLAAAAPTSAQVIYGPLRPMANTPVHTDAGGNLGITGDVVCTSGCSGGTTDSDDGSVAAGQSTGLAINLAYLWNGVTWARTPGDGTNGLKVQLSEVTQAHNTIPNPTKSIQIGGANADGGTHRHVGVSNAEPGANDVGLFVRNISGMGAPGSAAPNLQHVIAGRDPVTNAIRQVDMMVSAPTGTENGVVVRLVTPTTAIPVDVAGTTERTSSGALGALNAAVTIDGAGYQTIGVRLASGTLTGTVVFQASPDNVDWDTVEAVRNNSRTSVQSIALTSPSGDAELTFLVTAPFRYFRIVVLTYTSGTTDAVMKASTLSPAYVAPPVMRMGTGTIAAAAQFVLTNSNGAGSVLVRVGGTLTSGTIQVFGATSGAILSAPNLDVMKLSTGLISSTITTVGDYLVIGPSPYYFVGAIALGGFSGSVTTEIFVGPTTDFVQVSKIVSALPAGTNILGKVGIDQTTPGTTNAVSVTNSFALEATQLLGNASLATLAGAVLQPGVATPTTAAVLVQMLSPGPPLPLFPCNAVRRTHCQPKGY